MKGKESEGKEGGGEEEKGDERRGLIFLCRLGLKETKRQF